MIFFPDPRAAGTLDGWIDDDRWVVMRGMDRSMQCLLTCGDLIAMASPGPEQAEDSLQHLGAFRSLLSDRGGKRGDI